MNDLCRMSAVLLITLHGMLFACSEDTGTALASLVDLPDANDEIVKDLEQEQLDALCAQAQEAGLAYMARHQANLCGVAALLAEEDNELDCAEEYDKCMAIDIQTEFIELCTAAEQGCACGWDKATSTSVFNCHDTVTEFGTCLAEIYQTVDQTHDEISVTCSDEDSAQNFYDTSGERVPTCVEDVFPSCLLIWELSWSFSTDSLYKLLYL